MLQLRLWNTEAHISAWPPCTRISLGALSHWVSFLSHTFFLPFVWRMWIFSSQKKTLGSSTQPPWWRWRHPLVEHLGHRTSVSSIGNHKKSRWRCWDCCSRKVKGTMSPAQLLSSWAKMQGSNLRIGHQIPSQLGWNFLFCVFFYKSVSSQYHVCQSKRPFWVSPLRGGRQCHPFPVSCDQHGAIGHSMTPIQPLSPSVQPWELPDFPCLHRNSPNDRLRDENGIWFFHENQMHKSW